MLRGEGSLVGIFRLFVRKRMAVAAGCLAWQLVGCNSAIGVTPNIQVPANYRNWPPFIMNVDRATTSNPTVPPQIRDIYLNQAGTAVQEGEAFPDGTVFVMDVFGVQQDGSGNLQLDDNGHPMKDKLLKILLMGKELGWNAYRPALLSTGDWLYFAYQPDATTQITSGIDGCFDCHLTLSADVDWVFHYKDYFAARASAAVASP